MTYYIIFDTSDTKVFCNHKKKKFVFIKKKKKIQQRIELFSKNRAITLCCIKFRYKIRTIIYNRHQQSWFNAQG